MVIKIFELILLNKKFKPETLDFIGLSQDVEAHIDFIEIRHQFSVDRASALEQGFEDLHEERRNT